MQPTNCPRDGHSLEYLVTGAIETPVCSQCQGLWTSAGALEKIRRSGAAWRLPLSTDPTGGGFDRRAPVHCFCGFSKPMKRRKAGGIEYDLCRGCKAIWLDGGEVYSVVDLEDLNTESPGVWAHVLDVLLVAFIETV